MSDIADLQFSIGRNSKYYKTYWLQTFCINTQRVKGTIWNILEPTAVPHFNSHYYCPSIAQLSLENNLVHLGPPTYQSSLVTPYSSVFTSCLSVFYVNIMLFGHCKLMLKTFITSDEHHGDILLFYYGFLLLLKIWLPFTSNCMGDNCNGFFLCNSSGVLWTIKLHLTFHQHEGEEITTEFSFLGEPSF